MTGIVVPLTLPSLYKENSWSVSQIIHKRVSKGQIRIGPIILLVELDCESR